MSVQNNNISASKVTFPAPQGFEWGIELDYLPTIDNIFAKVLPDECSSLFLNIRARQILSGEIGKLLSVILGMTDIQNNTAKKHANFLFKQILESSFSEIYDLFYPITKMDNPEYVSKGKKLIQEQVRFCVEKLAKAENKASISQSTGSSAFLIHLSTHQQFNQKIQHLIEITNKMFRDNLINSLHEMGIFNLDESTQLIDIYCRERIDKHAAILQSRINLWREKIPNENRQLTAEEFNLNKIFTPIKSQTTQLLHGALNLVLDGITKNKNPPQEKLAPKKTSNKPTPTKSAIPSEKEHSAPIQPAVSSASSAADLNVKQDTKDAKISVTFSWEFFCGSKKINLALEQTFSELAENPKHPAPKKNKKSPVTFKNNEISETSYIIDIANRAFLDLAKGAYNEAEKKLLLAITHLKERERFFKKDKTLDVLQQFGEVAFLYYLTECARKNGHLEKEQAYCSNFLMLLPKAIALLETDNQSAQLPKLKEIHMQFQTRKIHLQESIKAKNVSLPKDKAKKANLTSKPSPIVASENPVGEPPAPMELPPLTRREKRQLRLKTSPKPLLTEPQIESAIIEQTQHLPDVSVPAIKEDTLPSVLPPPAPVAIASHRPKEAKKQFTGRWQLKPKKSPELEPILNTESAVTLPIFPAAQQTIAVTEIQEPSQAIVQLTKKITENEQYLLALINGKASIDDMDIHAIDLQVTALIQDLATLNEDTSATNVLQERLVQITAYAKSIYKIFNTQKQVKKHIEDIEEDIRSIMLEISALPQSDPSGNIDLHRRQLSAKSRAKYEELEAWQNKLEKLLEIVATYTKDLAPLKLADAKGVQSSSVSLASPTLPPAGYYASPPPHSGFFGSPRQLPQQLTHVVPPQPSRYQTPSFRVARQPLPITSIPTPTASQIPAGMSPTNGSLAAQSMTGLLRTPFTITPPAVAPNTNTRVSSLRGRRPPGL